jgi:hypothetical protein
MGDIGPRIVILALAALGLLAPPSPAHGGEIHWYTRDDGDSAAWSAATDLVWRGEPVSIQRWSEGWPPRPEPGDAADLWRCWLIEEPSPVLVVAPAGAGEHLHVPLQAEGLSRDEVVRAALLLTQSMRRSIQIADGGWMPAADLASLFGGDLRPAVEVDDAVADGRGHVPEPPDEPVEPSVEPPLPRRTASVDIGIGVGPAMRPGDGAFSLAPSVRLAAVVGPWIGPGASLVLDVLGARSQDGYDIALQRVLVAGRWQFTPAARAFAFPLTLGLGVGVTRARLTESDLESAGTVVPPVALAGAAVQWRIGPTVSLAIQLEATVDLMAVRIAVEGPDPRVEVDVHVFTLTPRLEVVLHPRPR